MATETEEELRAKRRAERIAQFELQEKRDRIKAEYAKSRGVRESRAGMDLGFLNKKAKLVRVPHQDHCTFWNKNGKPYCIVNQPYGFSLEDMREAVACADKYGLDVCVSSWPSWHYEGVVSVIWTVKGFHA